MQGGTGTELVVDAGRSAGGTTGWRKISALGDCSGRRSGSDMDSPIDTVEKGNNRQFHFMRWAVVVQCTFGHRSARVRPRAGQPGDVVHRTGHGRFHVLHISALPRGVLGFAALYPTYGDGQAWVVVRGWPIPESPNPRSFFPADFFTGVGRCYNRVLLRHATPSSGTGCFDGRKTCWIGHCGV